MKGRINPSLLDKLVPNGRELPDGASRAGGTADPDDDWRHGRVVGDSIVVDVPVSDAGRVTMDIQVYGEMALRESIRRQLYWILNTTNLEAAMDLSQYPLIRTSVLNFGIAEHGTQTSSATDDRAARIRKAIHDFEPRLDRNSVAIMAVPDTDAAGLMTYIISADIVAAGNAFRVRFYTDVETDTGNANVRE